MQQRRSIVGLDDGQEFANLKASMSRVKIDTTDQVRATGRDGSSSEMHACFLNRGGGGCFWLLI